MKYNTKIIIDDIELLEEGSDSVNSYVSDIQLKQSTTLSEVGIGSTASDQLSFTINNPYKSSFDNCTVKFYIKANDYDLTTSEGLAEEVGTDTTEEEVTDVDIDNYIEETEDEEDVTTEEEAEAETIRETDITNLYNLTESEEEESEAEEETEEEELDEWQLIGIYYVNSQSILEDSIRVTALDGLSKLNNATFTPTSTSCTLQELYDDFRTQCSENFDITVDEDELGSDIAINWNINATYRQTIGYIAGLVGGYATFGLDNTLGIDYFDFKEDVIIKEDLISYKETSSNDKIINSLTCKLDDENFITVGDGTGISFENPFMTESVLTDIFSSFESLRVKGVKLSTSWDTTLQSGEFARIMSKEEYINYLELKNKLSDTSLTADEILTIKSAMTQLGDIIQVTNQTISFNGSDSVTVIDSLINTESENETEVVTPTITKIIEAGKHATNYITEAEDGALIIARDTDDYKVRIDADSLDVINGNTTVATFGESTIIGDKNNGSVLEIEKNNLKIEYYDTSTQNITDSLFSVNLNTSESEKLREEKISAPIKTEQDGTKYIYYFETSYAIDKISIVMYSDDINNTESIDLTRNTTQLSKFEFKIETTTQLTFEHSFYQYIYITYDAFIVQAEIRGDLTVRGNVGITSDLECNGNLNGNVGNVDDAYGEIQIGDLVILCSQITCNTTKSTSNQDFYVDFGGKFDSRPNIQLTNQNIPGNYHFHYSVAGASSSGFNLRIRSYEGSAHSYTFFWQAIGKAKIM